jgi:polyphenol oxidase
MSNLYTRHAEEANLTLFRSFPELRIGIFGKDCAFSSDEECAQSLGFERLAKLHQVHGNITHVISQPTGFEAKGDGLITSSPHLALSVRWADCQALVIYAPQKKVLGVLHAGWRGMAVKVITKFYETLYQSFGIQPEKTFIGISPSICRHCMEFIDAKAKLPKHLHPFVGNDHLDLPAAADSELASLGVPKDHIERHPACTRCGEACLPDRQGFWSWRRDKKEDARNYLIAGITK